MWSSEQNIGLEGRNIGLRIRFCQVTKQENVYLMNAVLIRKMDNAMEQIIAGRFQSANDADAVAALLSQYIDTADICIFYNGQPGQHDATAHSGEEDDDSGTQGAGKSSVATALAAGLAAGAIGAVGGPITALAAAGIGAYAGSLVGALHGMGNHDVNPHAPEHRQAGMMLSVRIANPRNENRIIDTLRAQGAADIERAQGEWRDGDWIDFDPLAAPRLIAGAAN
jgi:hypothetical protein